MAEHRYFVVTTLRDTAGPNLQEKEIDGLSKLLRNAESISRNRLETRFGARLSGSKAREQSVVPMCSNRSEVFQSFGQLPTARTGSNRLYIFWAWTCPQKESVAKDPIVHEVILHQAFRLLAFPKRLLRKGFQVHHFFIFVVTVIWISRRHFSARTLPGPKTASDKSRFRKDG
jgi:hypothetical protein